ncbi:MAG: diaminopimelate decarboxylase [Paludibacteraceae bacterium]|nr:diaminopimelate decarboxylase [Paludibacteraceae bacterium]MBP6284838.1 diaminopimelate decarboxylase [Paludibacteraceae bacterium]
MNNNQLPLTSFKKLPTPFYYYDTALLRQTIQSLQQETNKHNIEVHYAVKANANDRILGIIANTGCGADCVSGNEIKAAIKAGFPSSKIVFAGVGKDDWEINIALDNDIFCFNCESIPEIEIINQLAKEKNKTASIALRINPDVKADTHHYITTGLSENKFGINLSDLEKVIKLVQTQSNIKLIGLHFHIGSQIKDMNNFVSLCKKINEIQEFMLAQNVNIENINVGGGLGIDYENPNENPIPNFAKYIEVFVKHIALRPNQRLHIEPGRSIVAQCGSLIAKVLYVKEGTNTKFAILNAGMTELIRPALYQAYHFIENLSSEEENETYDIVGPICESSDVFAKGMQINKVKRGDLIALRSAGAYGEVMASQYNLRQLPNVFLTEDL